MQHDTRRYDRVDERSDCRDVSAASFLGALIAFRSLMIETEGTNNIAAEEGSTRQLVPKDSGLSFVLRYRICPHKRSRTGVSAGDS
jgi:hypothetical protein